jgi:hypothetical protein
MQRFAINAANTDFPAVKDELKNSVGLVFLGAGGDPQEWIEGISGILIKDGIAKGTTADDLWRKSYLLKTTSGRSDLVLIPKDGVLDMGKLAPWRIKFGDVSWTSDYVENYAGDHPKRSPSAIPSATPSTAPSAPGASRPSGLKVVPFSGDDIRMSQEVLRTNEKDPSARMVGAPVVEKALVYVAGTSSKYHYFALFQNASKDWIAANTFGRIGYKPRVAVIASSPSRAIVESEMNKKYEMKKLDANYVPMTVPKVASRQAWWKVS